MYWLSGREASSRLKGLLLVFSENDVEENLFFSRIKPKCDVIKL